MIASGREGPYQLFSRGDIVNWFNGNYTQVRKEIRGLKDGELENETPETLEQKYYEKFSVEPPVLDFNEITWDHREEEVRGQFGEPGIDAIGYVTPVTVVEYHVSFVGNKGALIYRPSEGISYSKNAWFEGNELIFEIPTADYDSEKIDAEFESIKNKCLKQVEGLTADIEKYNEGMSRIIKEELSARYATFEKKREMLGRIPYPLRRKQKDTGVFNRFRLKRKPKIEPAVEKLPVAGEFKRYYLDDERYLGVLGVINEGGKGFERHPGDYVDFDEAGFRNLILDMLQLNFEGTVTAETFNLSGKSDILIREHGDVLFVAECKMWEGPEGYFDAIRQLYNYITWSDTKTAIIIFDRSKTFVSKNSVPDITPEFPDFRDARATYDANWSEYIINKEGEPELSFTLNVLCFHIPRPGD